ncbi:MAG: hypothetical protein FJ009_05100 [Chloroflexi bacterium]|nr:hypothetical protein [Chloroflexota bacterium]
MKLLRVPNEAIRLGFVNDPIGSHGSRTIMLAELRQLLSACPVSANLEEYRTAVLDQNTLMKKTTAARKESFRRLREFYALNLQTNLFRVLREMWDDDVQSQPMLAMLCATARDPLLRATADLILATPVGKDVTSHMFADAVHKSFPNRYSPGVLAGIGRRTASSWQQSGHLQGRLRKIRAQAHVTPASLAYALFLGFLCSVRGEALFQTLWCQLLDAPIHTLYDLALVAAQRGWIDYRHAGGITEVGFRYLLRGRQSTLPI